MFVVGCAFPLPVEWVFSIREGEFLPTIRHLPLEQSTFSDNTEIEP